MTSSTVGVVPFTCHMTGALAVACHTQDRSSIIRSAVVNGSAPWPAREQWRQFKPSIAHQVPAGQRPFWGSLLVPEEHTRNFQRLFWPLRSPTRSRRIRPHPHVVATCSVGPVGQSAWPHYGYIAVGREAHDLPDGVRRAVSQVDLAVGHFERQTPRVAAARARCRIAPSPPSPNHGSRLRDPEVTTRH